MKLTHRKEVFMTKPVIADTDENRKIVDAYVDKQLESAYSVSRIDRHRVSAILVALYALLGLPVPEIRFVSGPMAAIEEAVNRGDKRAKESIRRDLYIPSWRSYWLQRYGCGLEFDPEIFDSKDTEELRLWLELSKESHCLLCYEECVIVTDRPLLLSVDSQGRLHHESQPALLEGDGVSIYAWHGVETPSYVIEHPEQITVAKIESENNAEIKRVMIERFGLQRFIEEAGAELIHSDRDQFKRERKLWRKNISGGRPLLTIQVINSTAEPDGSFKTYFLGVQEECRPLLSDIEMGEPQELNCQNAIASLWGLTGEQYHPAIET